MPNYVEDVVGLPFQHLTTNRKAPHESANGHIILPLGIEAHVPIRDDPAATFSIAIAIRRAHPELLDEINAALERRRPEIDQILRDYGVPALPLEGEQVSR